MSYSSVLFVTEFLCHSIMNIFFEKGFAHCDYACAANSVTPLNLKTVMFCVTGGIIN